MNVLVVEDDRRVSDLLYRALTAEGHAATIACTAGAAAAALPGDFDVVVLDLMLPDVPGRELCANLRATGIDLPLLMLTAMDAVDDRIDGLRAGADDYLTKPFHIDELIARLEALQRRARGHAPSRVPQRLCGAGIEMNPTTVEVRSKGVAVAMTRTEFMLLEALMEQAGQVLSREYILRRVWGYDSDPLTNVVDVYIRRLRKKLDLDPEHGAIRAVRGYGYRFVGDEN